MSIPVVMIELVPIAALPSNASGARSVFALAALLVLVALLAAIAIVRIIWGLMAVLLERWWAAVKVTAMLGVAFVLLVMLAVGPPRSSSTARLEREPASTADSTDKGSSDERQVDDAAGRDGNQEER